MTSSAKRLVGVSIAAIAIAVLAWVAFERPVAPQQRRPSLATQAAGDAHGPMLVGAGDGRQRGHLTLRCVDSLDGLPVGGCRVEVTDPAWGNAGAGTTTSRTGEVSLSLTFDKGMDPARSIVQISSPTHARATFDLQSAAVQSGVCRLRGLGALAVVHPDGAPGATTSTVEVSRALAAAERLATQSRVREGATLVEGLRPGGAYVVVVRRGDVEVARFDTVVAEAVPGEPRLGYSMVAQARVRIRVDGLRGPEDAARLRARAFSGPAAGITWDGANRCGWTDLHIAPGAGELEIMVEGLFGQVVGSAVVSPSLDGTQIPRVSVTLVDATYRLIYPDVHEEPEDWVSWRSGVRGGGVGVSHQRLESFVPRASGSTSIRVGAYEAADVDLAATRDIHLKLSGTATLVVDPDGGASADVRIIRRSGRADDVVLGPTVLAVRTECDVLPGIVFVQVGERIRSAELSLRAGDRAVVRLSELMSLASIQVSVRSAPPQVLPGTQVELRLTRTAGGRAHVLRSMAAETDGEPQVIAGLGAGKYEITARAPGAGQARVELDVQAGDDKRIEISQWNSTQTVDVRFAGFDIDADSSLLRAFLLPRGTAPDATISKGGDGSLRISVEGQGDLALQAGRFVWIVPQRALAAGSVVLQAAPQSEPVTIRLSPWWAERTEFIGAICVGPGPYFAAANRAGASEFVLRGAPSARILVVALAGDKIAAVSLKAGTSGLTLDAPPAELLVSVAHDGQGGPPVTQQVEVLSIDGVAVRETVFAALAGPPRTWGSSHVILADSPLELRAVGMNAAGGIDWASPVTSTTDGAREIVMTLRRVSR